MVLFVNFCPFFGHCKSTIICDTFDEHYIFISAEELSQTPEASPELTKRSWFGSLMSTDRDETYTIIVKEKPLASIKADLIQAFLSVRMHFLNRRKNCLVQKFRHSDWQTS